ncbi:hypothetical protein HKX48_000327, partial [Thoreauomyces humboldtii]
MERRSRSSASQASAAAAELRPIEDIPGQDRSKLMRYLESAAWITIALLVGYFANLAAALQNYGYG